MGKTQSCGVAFIALPDWLAPHFQPVWLSCIGWFNAPKHSLHFVTSVQCLLAKTSGCPVLHGKPLFTLWNSRQPFPAPGLSTTLASSQLLSVFPVTGLCLQERDQFSVHLVGCTFLDSIVSVPSVLCLSQTRYIKWMNKCKWHGFSLELGTETELNFPNVFSTLQSHVFYVTLSLGYEGKGSLSLFTDGETELSRGNVVLQGHINDIRKINRGSFASFLSPAEKILTMGVVSV